MNTDPHPARAGGKPALAELERRRASVLHPPAEAVERLHRRGKLSARERIELLLDPGSEWGFGYTLERDSKLLGFGTVDGRPVAFKTYDKTHRGGAVGMTGARHSFVQDALVEKAGLPMFFLSENAGGVMGLASLSSTFVATAQLLQTAMIGSRRALPRRSLLLTAILGTTFAPWQAAEADFTVMPRTAAMTFVSPLIMEYATGRHVDVDEMGGADVHSQVTGQVHATAEDEEAAILLLRKVFGYLPSNVFEAAPVVRTGDPADRRDEELRTLVPSYPNRPYDMKAVIERVVDTGSFLEWQPEFAKSLITGLARMDGSTVVVVANQPKTLAGSTNVDGLRKGARALELAQTFGLPVITFVDTPGLMTTKEEEHKGLLAEATRHAMLRTALTVPRVTVVVGKAIGYGTFQLGAGEPEGVTLCWPSAQISYVGPEGGVRVAYRKELEASSDPRGLLDQLAEPFRAAMNPWRGARLAGVDDIIDPADTRPVAIHALRSLARASTRVEG